MKVVIFGATGMIGQGALRECLLDSAVTAVVAVGRAATRQSHAKLRDVVVPDLFDLSSVTGDFDGADACLFCVGITSAGTSNADYRRITYDLPLSVANVLVARNPGMTFVYVSGAGASSVGRGPMWARVKGEAEDALFTLPFRGVYVLRPAMVQPLHGITSRTAMYRVLYRLFMPLMPTLKGLFPSYVTTTERIGRAMLILAKRGSPRRLLENADINHLVSEQPAS